jgi:rhodanese-related sulfurtransferase
MKKLLRLLLLPFTLLSITASGQVKSKAYNTLLSTLLSHTVTEISVQEASQIENTAIFLDAREPEEYQVSKIKNAIPVGYDKFDISSVKEIPKDSEIIIYCSVGYRSEKIAEKLIANGYTNVSNLYGGIFEWKNQGHEVSDSVGITENTHAFNLAWGVWLNVGKKVYE